MGESVTADIWSIELSKEEDQEKQDTDDEPENEDLAADDTPG